MPSDAAEDNDSTSPSRARTSVSVPRAAYASICSPSRAQPARRVTMSTSSALTSSGAADRHPRHPERRLSRRHRHGLSVLATRARPGVEVVADGVDRLQHLEAVADDVGGAHWLADLPVLDHVTLRHAEDEVAGCGVHGSAPELHAVD